MEIQQKMQKQFDLMCQTNKLFRVTLSGRDVWRLYLESFGQDSTFRDPESSVHNCNLCNNFLRRYGNIVAVDENYNLMTIFDFEIEGEYKETVETLSKCIKASSIQDVFFETYAELNSLNYEKCSKTASQFKLGIDKNHKKYTQEEVDKFGVVNTKDIYTFEHMYLNLPTLFVDKSGNSVETLMGSFRDAKEVFKRGMEEISLDTLNLVVDLINQGSLLDGTTHLPKIQRIIPLKKAFDKFKAAKNITLAQCDNYCWVESYKLPIAKFKNELIGVLCSELSEGEDLNKACQSWNKRVDPVNYMKTTAPITKKQIEEAKKFVEENGYEESFDRRMATIDDIKASEILHMNVGEDKISKVSIFDGVKSTSTRHKRNEFDGVEEVSIEKFMKDILPSCTSVEAFLINSQEGNLVSLTTAINKDSKPIFKWPNNYSWTFNGNLAGKSQIKEAVKTKGGNIEGVLRFSMIWNDGNGNDNSDLDAWCIQPDNQRIGYSSGFRKDQGNAFTSAGGQLDLDNTNPSGKLAVENIYFKDIKKMKNGVYKFWVHQFSERSSQGFKAEIEFDGEIYYYEFNKKLSQSENITVAEVTLKDGKFSIDHKLPETGGLSIKEIYGLETNQFHKVNLVCLSPNHWESEVGNKHYFFMLDKCKAPGEIRSFHNENLNADLTTHKRVMEVLGSQTMVKSTDKQLSGLGYNSTTKEELIVRLQGSFKRVVKIKF